MVDATLKQLDAWFNEPSQGGDRPKLLSKLATLELCGWIEGELDRLVLLAESQTLNDSPWVRKEIIGNTFGFQYDKHWRPMLAKLVGEVFARRVELELQSSFPGDLDRLKSMTSTLWRLRCDFAHADMTANVAAQQNFWAPSWSLNQHRILSKLLAHYEQSMVTVLNQI